MNRLSITMALTAVLIAGGAVAGNDQGKDANGATAAKVTPQTTCPVTGSKINKKLYVDHNGQRVYVCCKGCIRAVQKDPEKYIKKLENEGITVAALQTSCPITGEKINKKLYVDHDGKRIYVCCKGCIGPVQKDPEKYIKKLAEKGEVLVSVPQ